ncbi:MAG: PIG-L family deacetylase [Acidimicrobiia bacterium]
MATLVFFHAHPDDESITTGGSMAKYAAAGHRVVLVLGTGGEHGENPDDLAPGETLADRRRAETMRSAEALGIGRVEFLGYQDSGMDGWDQNHHEASFWQADVEEAAQRLAAILRQEAADVLTVYDEHGGYGHPDHIQVHRVGHRAAALAATPRLFEATMNRDAMRRNIDQAIAAGIMSVDDAPPTEGADAFGTPEAMLTTCVDVTAFVEAKRASMACHRSQITDSSFFLQMPVEMFAAAFGTEWYIHIGEPPGLRETELLG